MAAVKMVPRKLLFVIDYFRNPNAGTEGQLYALIQGLDRTRFEPLLLVFGESDYLRENDFPCEYRVLGHRRLASPTTWCALWKMARRYRAQGVSVAHVFFNDPSVICPPIFHYHGIRTVISRRDMGYWYTGFYRTLLKVTGRFVSAVVVNSQAVGEVTVDSEKIPQSKMHVIYNGYAEKADADAVPTALAQIREQDPDAVIAGLVANIRPIKRIGDAIEALGGKGRSEGRLHLVIIGDGDASGLVRRADEFGVGARVHFLGPRSDVKACLKAMDMALLCSESEGFSNAIIEYMQAGLPAVCSAVGGNPEAVTHGETGFLYPCGNTHQLAGYLSNLTEDADLRRLIGNNARKSAVQRFGMERMINEHQSLYDRLGVSEEQ